MFLSFIIPIYNDEKFLNECLDSCLNQQLSKDDYELICVDDGSTDRTPEILKEYAARYPNIHVIFKKHGSEYGYGRNIGLEAAVGEFVWFVDHDDVVAENAVDELKRITEENPDYDRYAFPYYHFYSRFSEEERRLIQEGTLPNSSGIHRKEFHVWSCIFRRSFLSKYGILPRSRHVDDAGRFWEIEPFTIWGHDWSILNECYENHIRSLQLTGRPLYYYRLHPGQQISNNDPEAVKRRNLLQGYKILFLAHRAFLQKQRYLQLADTDPAASQEALVDTIVRLREIAVYAGKVVVGWAWKDAMRRFQEKDIFFHRKPKAYTFSLFSYLKNTPIRERYRPSNILLYYAFTFTGVKLYYWLNSVTTRRDARRVKKLAKAEKDARYERVLEARRSKNLRKTVKKLNNQKNRERKE